MSRDSAIEVFQDFYVSSPDAGSAAIRDVLLSVIRPPWHHAQDVEAELLPSVGASEPLVFERAGDQHIRAARVFLFPRDNRYELGNIVPCDNGPDLSPHGYNDLLNDFVNGVVEPAIRNTVYVPRTTKRHQTITDWTSDDAASALRLFSAAANKATGASHPADAERWRKFLIADHRAHSTWNHSHFERWLVEVERWPPEEAQELALQREYALELLDQYDKAV